MFRIVSVMIKELLYLSDPKAHGQLFIMVSKKKCFGKKFKEQDKVGFVFLLAFGNKSHC